MRFVHLFAAIVLAWPALSQDPSGLAITNYRFVGEERRISATVSEYEFRGDLTNTGVARASVVATIVGSAPNIVPVQGVLRFAPVPAGSTVTSSNTIILRVDRSIPFELNTVVWSFSNAQAPTAVPGPSQTVALLATVYLNGSGSTNPPGMGPLTYSWSFVQRPLPSAALLVNPNSVNPTFVADAAGTYVLRLTVSNGGASDSANVVISTNNTTPVANPGRNQSVGVTTLVQLDGSRSSDVNGDPLTFRWSFASRPAGSAAVLINPTAVNPQFRVDRAGTYLVQLVVNDGRQDSAPEVVTISTRNTAPVANPGPAQSATLNSSVQLTGAGSTDVDGDALTYLWSWNSVPSGSAAALSSTTAVNPTFTLDRPGTYVAQLIVNDGTVNSTPVTVTISTNAILPPTAIPGANQSVQQGALVSLSASGTDPQNQPLTYTWAFTSRPTNSSATLTNPTSATPTFTADRAGLFVVQLIANNGYLDSAPATVTITTSGTAPVANPGAAQDVNLGALVNLTGAASSDADNDPLTFAWSFTSRPAGSNATLAASTSATPTFVADRLGTYVVQLIVNDGFYNSVPVTVTIRVGATLTFTPPSLTFDDRGPANLTLNLSGPAPSGGLSINLLSTNPNVVTVPATVTFAQGANTANIVVTPVTPGGTSIIRASLLPDVPQASANVTLNWQDIILPANVSVAAGSQANFNLALANPAAAATTVTLQVSDPSKATLTASVLFNAGQTQPVAQPILTGLAAGPVTVTATAAGLNTAVTPVLVTGSSTGAILLPSTSAMTQAQTLAYPVALTVAAPSGGVVISLSSNAPGVVAISPASVTIPAGQLQATVVPQLTATAVGTAVITASASGYANNTKSLQVTVPLAPTANAGPAQTVPQGAVVALSGSGTDPQSLPLTYQWTLANRPTGSAATLNSTQPGPSFSPDLPGAYLAQLIVSNGYTSSAPATVAITVSNRGNLVLPSSVALVLGTQSALPISLSTPAPAGGVTISLSSSLPTRMQVIPQSFTIAAGETTPVSMPIVQGLDLGTVTLTATALGYTPASQSARVTATINLTPNALTFIDTVTQTLTLVLSGPAPASGLTVNVTSSNPAVATVPASVSFLPNASTAMVPVTGIGPGTAVIRASATELAETTASITFSPPDILLPQSFVVPVGEQAFFPITLQSPSAGTTFVQLTSSDPAIASFSIQNVIFNDGQTTPVSQPRLTGWASGSIQVSATAVGLNPSRANVRVGLGLTFASPSLAVSGTATQNILLSLSGPAPQGGVTVNLASSNPAVATVPATLVFGATTTAVTVPVTGVSAGSVTITATSSQAGQATLAVTVSPVAGSGSIVLPSVGSMAPGQTLNFPVSLSAPAGPGGLLVSLASTSGAVSVSPLSVTVPAGQTQASTVPVLTAVSAGSADISASGTGYTTASRTVTVVAATPAQVIASSGGGQSAATSATFASPLVALVRDAQGNAMSGVLVTFTAPSSGASATFAQATATTNSSGLATSAVPVANSTAGSYTVSASVAGVSTPATFSLTNNAPAPPPGGGGGGGGNAITLAPVTVGQNLQALMTLTLPQAAPAGGQRVTITTSDPGMVLVAGRPTDAGGAQLTFNVGEGLLTAGFYVQGIAASGIGNITVTSSGLGTGVGTVTLAPSGFTLSGPNSPASQSFSLGQGSSVGLTVSAARLNSSLNFVETQQIRGGLSVTVSISSAPGVAGSVSPATVMISGGNSSAPTTFNANGPSTGSTQLTAGVPSGFSQPGLGADSLAATVTAATMMTSPVTVGENLQATTNIRLNAPAPPEGMPVTIVSNDPGKVTFATSATAAGSGSITITIPAGRTNSADFFVQGLANNGVVSFTASSPNFGTASGSVTLTRSGFVITGPFGVGTDFFTTTGAASTSLTVLSTRLDANFNSIEPQPVRGGLTVDVPVSSATLATGVITGSPVRFTGSVGSAAAQFQPVAAGTTLVSLAPPSGFTPAATGGSLTATVRVPGLVIEDGATVGSNLQTTGSLLLGQGAPTGGLVVTISSNSPSLLLSTTETGAGAASISIPVSAGQAAATYYIQGRASSGSATYTATAPGYQVRTATVNFAPSGLILTGPFGIGFPFSMTLSGGPRPATITSGLLDPVTNAFVMPQALSGGLSLSLPLTNSNPNTASLSSPVTLAGGSSTVDIPVQPLAIGATLLALPSPPSGFTLPRSATSLTVAVQ